MPVKITFDDTQLAVPLTTGQRFLSARFSDLSVPLADVQSVRPCPELELPWFAHRFGTMVPYGLRAGNFYHWGKKKDFVYANNMNRTVQITLKEHAPYGSLILEVEDDKTPAEVVAEIKRACNCE
ncbi:hypothetical protein HDU86_002444 [Geranomyces michiganensis]|nr:hypothetical protein HDU86_002444 [Geranomyces michiganensis]